MSDIKLSVIIPAYNEEKRIGPTLESVSRYLEKQNYSYEIMVVANNCTDRTDDVVREYQEKISHLELIDLGPGIPGKGGAVREGLLKTKGQYAVFMDADNSTRLVELDKFWPYFAQGYDIVFGSRDIKGAQVEVSQSKLRETFGKMGNLLIQFVLLPGIKDTQCGFKAFSRKAVQAIFLKQKISGWGFDMEVLALGKKLGFKMKEVPIAWYNAVGSKVSWTGYLESFRDLFVIRFNLWTGKYK
ncbi:glycosyltransferase family 2 protein [Patescibacteria group bacterium]|nr:glycosyltransferase family 2 protein [Patescibacteria group bacterium]